MLKVTHLKWEQYCHCCIGHGNPCRQIYSGKNSKSWFAYYGNSETNLCFQKDGAEVSTVTSKERFCDV